VTWQRSRGDEANLLSPLLERLRALHLLAWGDSLDERALADLLAQAEVRCEDSVDSVLPTSAPSPIPPPERVPAVISASAYNALMACPYQFFARYVLGLRELDEVQEDVDKADYGTRVHDILAQFHRAHPRVSDLTPEAAQRALETLSGAAFENVIAADYLASAWLARWKAMIPRYVEWQRAREAAGWTFRAAEDDRRLEIATPAGHKLTLRGRIDRVDVRDDGAVAVIDYKTQARQALKAKLQDPGEDVQLPVYALLWGGPVAAAAFLSMDRDGVLPVDLDGDVGALAVLVQERLAALFDAMLAGAPLPAQGADAVCVHCEMNGLCRRKHWP
jgi:ATP-dependent helicase/nuclease subunit B